MTAYYNENDKKAAAWLRELIKAGHIQESRKQWQASGVHYDRPPLQLRPVRIARRQAMSV